MNATLSIPSESFGNNSLPSVIEVWFIPLDILNLICLSSLIIITIVYLCVTIIDKTCHTVRMMLFANTCLTSLVCASMLLISTLFTLNNDLEQIQYEDAWCVLRGYLLYALPALHAYSYVTSTVYQYILTVYPTRLLWQSARAQLVLIIFGWILAFLLFIPFLFTGDIIYDVDNQICEVLLRLSVAVFYIPLVIFITPISMVIFIYLKLIQYVKDMGQNLAAAVTLIRARRNLTMVRRIVILVHVLLIAGCPMSLFFILSFFHSAPKYYSRIGYFFINIALLCVMIVLFQFTDPLKVSIKKESFVDEIELCQWRQVNP